MQTLRLQHHEQNYEPEAQEDAHFSFLTQALTVPVHILVSRFRNRREVELVMDVSDSASRFDCLLENYETVSVRAQALQESWDNLWTSQEPLLVPAIPLIGEQMSAMNRIRANLLKKMDSILESLQVLAKALLQYAEINSSIAEELKMEGIERLAMDKLFLAGLEEELVKRINIVSTKGSIHMLCCGGVGHGGCPRGGLVLILTLVGGIGGDIGCYNASGGPLDILLLGGLS